MEACSNFEFGERNRLIDEAFRGRMEPEEAEAEALRLGVRPLRSNPDLARFDPITKATWTLPMAIVWICGRNPEQVRESWDAYLQECWDWQPHRSRLPVDGGRSWEEISGWELKQREAATLDRLTLADVYDAVTGQDSGKRVTAVMARTLLWEALASGSLTATAIKDARPVQIPAHEWSYLTAKSEGNQPDSLHFKSTLHRVEYREATFSRADLCRLWTADINRITAGEDFTARLSHEKSWKAAVAWLTEQGNGERLSRSAVEQTLLEKFGMRSPKAREVWQHAAPTEWRKRGRRSKKP